MSGECTITIWVQVVHQEEVTQILDRNEDSIDDQGKGEGLYYFQFYDRKAAHLDASCNAMESAGIAYDIDIGREHENDSRMTDTRRFNEHGQMVCLHWMEEAEQLTLTELMSIVDNYQDLRDAIIQSKRAITPLPWDNQVEYGKRYCAAQLLLGS